MTRFMVLYNSDHTAAEQMAMGTPEQAKEGMDAWMSWGQNAGKALVDFGMPLQAASHVTADGVSGASSHAGGYSFLEADSVDEIQDLVAKHPHLQMPGNTIDVLEVLPMPGM